MINPELAREPRCRLSHDPTPAASSSRWNAIDDAWMSQPCSARSRPTLSPQHMAAIMAFGSVRDVHAGELLASAGDATYNLEVILSGSVEVVVIGNGDESVIVESVPDSSSVSSD